MAKKFSGGPGTYTQGGVNCTMNSPFGSASPDLPSNGMKGNFDASKASSKLPTKVYETQGKMGKEQPTQTAPSAQGQVRTGTDQFKYGGGKMRDGNGSR